MRRCLHRSFRRSLPQTPDAGSHTERRQDRRRRYAIAVAGAAAAVSFPLWPSAALPARAQVSTTSLLTNGGFETGDLSGWNTADVVDPSPSDNYNEDGSLNQGGFTVQGTGSSTAPFSGVATLGPSGGSFYALDDMNAPGEHALYQTFTVPLTALSMTVSFDLYNYDWAGFGGAVDPSGLDYTTGGAFNPNQHVRVDLLFGNPATADIFTIDPTAIVDTPYGPGVDPEAEQAPPQNPLYRTWTATLPVGPGLAGQSVVLRFAEVDNEGPLSVGVDNVQVTAQILPSATPEPGALPLLLTGSGMSLLLGSARLRRGRRR